MRILAVYPPYPGKMNNYLKLPSIELCILSKILSDYGYDMDLFDMRIDSLGIDDFINKIQKERYDVIYFEDCCETFCETIKLINASKEFDSNILTVLHSDISSLKPMIFMKRYSNIDFIVRYDDDYAFLNVVNEVIKNHNYHRIPNIAYRENCQIHITKVLRDYYDINDLPMPNRELYDLDKYLKNDSETIVKSSRGCIGRCEFCIKTKIENLKLFSIKRFCDEIEFLVNKGFKSFFFSDDTFAFSIKRLREFKNELESRKLSIKWTSNLRIKDISDELIQEMKSIGAYRVFIGIETINDESSKMVNKNITKEIIEEKIAILKKHNMEFHASFIIGCPGDTVEDLDRTIEFVKEINPEVVTFNTIKIYPGLDLYDNPDKYGVILRKPFWFENDEWTNEISNGTVSLGPDIILKYAKRMLFETLS